MTLAEVVHVLETPRDLTADNERCMQTSDLVAVSRGTSRSEFATIFRERSTVKRIFDIIGQGQVCQFHINEINLSSRFKPPMLQNIDDIVMMAIAHEDIKRASLVLNVFFVGLDDTHHFSGKGLSGVGGRVSQHSFRLVADLNEVNEQR